MNSSLFNFWLCFVGSLFGVFVAARAFLLLQKVWATLHCGAWASHCGGFSPWGACALGPQASEVAAHGLSSCGTWA